MLKQFIFLVITLFLLSSDSAFSQQTPQTPDSSKPSAEFISKAGIRRREYKERFKDLAAEEIQKVEEYGSDGAVKRRREVVSDLIIYQSQTDDSATAMVEYRNVRLVDGKAVTERDRRAEKLFERLAKADSRKKELERIHRESKRYDLNSSSYGSTLNQGLPLEESLTPSFLFTITGREQIAGRDVIVIDYQQVARIPGMENKLSLPEKLKGYEPQYRGRLWLDKDTARLWREERELILKHPALAKPLTFWRFEFSYADSRFDILTPKQITISTYTRGRDGADGSPELLIGGKATFEYSGFRRFDVTSSDAQINSKSNQ
ncbi:MAG TPA: hypothetical protein VF599_11950 [Pyrinomonadaceae bacterium]|jgi:hypothetical protein